MRRGESWLAIVVLALSTGCQTTWLTSQRCGRGCATGGDWMPGDPVEGEVGRCGASHHTGTRVPAAEAWSSLMIRAGLQEDPNPPIPHSRFHPVPTRPVFACVATASAPMTIHDHQPDHAVPTPAEHPHTKTAPSEPPPRAREPLPAHRAPERKIEEDVKQFEELIPPDDEAPASPRQVTRPRQLGKSLNRAAAREPRASSLQLSPPRVRSPRPADSEWQPRR